MLYLIAKVLLSGVLIAVASEVAKRYPGAGGLIASLPLVSVLAMIWLWRDTHDPGRIASLAISTLWFVLPSLALFVLMPVLLRKGFEFWSALGAGCIVTMALYAGMAWIGSRFGLRL